MRHAAEFILVGKMRLAVYDAPTDSNICVSPDLSRQGARPS